MIITRSGRPLGRFPSFKLAEPGRLLLTLKRIDVSDVGKGMVVEAFYEPLIEIVPGTVKTIVFRGRRKNLFIFLVGMRPYFQLTGKDEYDTDCGQNFQ